MSRIGGVGSLSSGQLKALNRIQQLSSAIAQNTERLSTFKRINSAKDDPSGLIQVSILQQELIAAQEASNSISRANGILNSADATTSEVVSQLQSARTLILETAGGSLSNGEIAGNQVEIDTLLRSVDILAQTSFSGRRLFDGSSGFRVSGYDSAEVLDVDVLDKQTADDVTVDIEVTQQAAQATDTYDNSVALAEDVTLLVTGSNGSASISLETGATTQDIVDAFNDVAYLTGISADIDGTDVDLTSVDYGSSAVIQVTATEGAFATAGGNDVAGTDAAATINGTSYTADGTTFSVHTGQTALVIELDPTANGSLQSFTVSGDGLSFIVGTQVTNTARIGLPTLSTAHLGGVAGKLSSLLSGGTNSLSSGNYATALSIVDNAISDVVRAQSVIGSFQSFVLDSSSNVLSTHIENASQALSDVQDTDIALETALLSNNQLLQETAYQALSISTLSSDSVLSLLQFTAARF